MRNKITEIFNNHFKRLNKDFINLLCYTSSLNIMKHKKIDAINKILFLKYDIRFEYCYKFTKLVDGERYCCIQIGPEICFVQFKLIKNNYVFMRVE
jgi:hypothetical protein